MSEVEGCIALLWLFGTAAFVGFLLMGDKIEQLEQDIRALETLHRLARKREEERRQ